MSVFRKYDSKSKQWDPVNTADATTVFSANPILTEESDAKSVEDILLKDRNDIELLKKNVSWLAKHGGGGGGYGSGSAAKATVQILDPNDNTTPVDSIIWKDSIQFIRIKIASSYNGTYKLVVKVNGKAVYEQQNVKRNTVIDVPTSVMGIGKNAATIEALAYDEADMEYSTTCKVSIASVELQKPTAVTLTQNQLLNSKPSVLLTYRTTIPGNYRMYYSSTMISYDANIGWKDSNGALDGNGRSQYIDMIGVGTTVSGLNVPLVDTYGDGNTNIIEPNAQPGVYARYFVMVSANDPTICSSVVSAQINVTVTNGLLVSPQFGTDEDEPYMISLDGVLNLQFITYSSNMGTYSYSVWYGEKQLTEIKSGQIYGTIITENLSLRSIFETPGKYELTIKATGLGANAEASVYLNVVEAMAEFVEAYKQSIDEYCIYDYTFWDNAKSTNDSATFINPNFNYAATGTHGELTQKLNIYNRGADSGSTQVYYKMYHTCVGELNSNGKRWFPANTNDTTSLIPGPAYQFTISLAYKIGKEVDDNATIFNLGNYQPATLGGDGTGFGILVTAHGYYIHIEDTVLEGELSDNSFTQLDIILKPHVNAGEYLLCVYQNAILTGATKVTFRSTGTGAREFTLSNFTTATIACRAANEAGGYYATTNAIDTDVYSVRMYSIPLNDGQIVCSHINNRANYERLTGDNTLNPELIMQLLTNNSILPDSEVEKDEEGNYKTDKICKIFNLESGEYTWGVSIEGTDVKLGDNLTNLPIPIVVVDAYNWKYSQDFINATTNTNPTAGKIRYIDGTKTIEHSVTVSLQGTTTLTYAAKNIDISFENATFSPKDTWFPEQTFTLKADVVDSGHMNNAVIGTFVNKCLNESTLLDKDAFPVSAKIQEYRRANGQQMPDSMTLKACIEGFPIVLVMSFLSESGEAREARVMGIYSFNLGRKSYVNMGFEVLKCLRNLDGTVANADTLSYPSLFAIPNESDKDTTYNAYCYEGSRSLNCSTTKDDEIDIDDSTATYDWAKVKVSNTGTDKLDWIWLPKVEKYGNYVSYLGKEVLDADNVPVVWNKENVKKYALIPDGYFWSNHKSYSSSLLWDPIYRGTNTTQADLEFQKLNDCIATKLQYVKGLYIDANGKTGTAIRAYNSNIQQYEIVSGTGEAWETAPVTGVKLGLNVPQAREPIELCTKNAAFYYVICMLFGLVDSFGKNMQMKNWQPNGSSTYQPRWSPTFYDMDTALGIDNAGGQTIPPTVFDESIINTPDNKVSFMYGSAPNSFNPLFTVFSNKMWGGLDNAMFQRQYSVGYGDETNYQVYSLMWSDLRCSMLTNVDDFIETFMSTQLNKCGEFLYNYDYNVKYIPTAQIDFLHGNRISFIKNWLKERIIFLDSVFGYKAPVESTYLKETATSEAPYIAPYNISWKNEARVSHNSESLKMPVTTNASVIMRTNIGNKSTTYTFVPKNIPTLVPVADSLNTPNIQTLLNNSDCIIDMDLTGIGIINIEGKDNIAVTGTNNQVYYGGKESLPELYYQYGSFSSLKKLNLRNSSIDTSLDYFRMFKTWDSSPYGVSPEAFTLQELNLSGIKSPNVTAKLSGIEATDEMVPAIYKAPFKNVSSVDVSNSNISTVTIPTGVSLYNLNITNSNIQSLSLIDQPLLAAPNFNGCKNLTSISMVNCSRFTSLTFNSTTKALKTLIINGCKNLETITINAGDVYTSLPAITIEDCPKLKTIRISGCTAKDTSANPDKKLILSNLPALEMLSVAGCHFEVIEWDGVYAKNEETGETVAWTLDYFRKDGWTREGHTKLKTLNISSSHVGTIYSRYYGGKTGINLTGFENGIDLTGFSSSNLTSLICNNNAYIKEVYFNNNFRTPFYITTANAFNRCTNLTRVYGFTVLAAAGIFDACPMFSIQGSGTNVTYDGKSVYQASRWMHPMDLGLLADGVDVTDEITDSKVGVKFLEGSNVTNMVLGGSNVSYCFRSTACTTFDVYYILMNILPSVQNINYLFHGATGVKWGWSGSISNDPHRYMFAKCQHVNNAQIVFQYTGGGGRLWSPYTDENGNFIPGIFTPLKNISGYNCMFWPMNNYIIDKNIFTTENGEDLGYTYIRYFTPGMVVNDVNNITYEEYSSLNSNPTGTVTDDSGNTVYNYEQHGDISGFFKNLPYVDDIFGIFNGIRYIDYSKFTPETPLGIPTAVKTLQGALVSTYANGELNLSYLFQDCDASNLENIYNSIRVTSVGGTEDIPIYLRMNVQESLFQDCDNLTNVGYATGTDFSGDNTMSAFSGAGIKKVLPRGNFPYTLLEGKSKLKSFVAFFNDCDMTEAEQTGKKLELPGSLFNSCSELRDISYCFYNIKTNQPIQLTSESFKNCPKLTTLNYLFGHDNEGKSSVREGQLPLRFFYTGSEMITKELRGTNFTKTINNVTYRQGTTIPTAIITTKPTETSIDGNVKTTITYTREFTNFDSIEDDDTKIIATPVTNMMDVITTVTVTTNSDGTTSTGTPKRTTANYVDPDFEASESNPNLHSYTYEYEQFNRSVNGLEGCFQYADFTEYSVSNYNDYEPESNPDYQPFDYSYENGRWSKAAKNNNRMTFEWIYDGDRQRYYNDAYNRIPKSGIVNGETYTYEHSLPDDAWIEGVDYNTMSDPNSENSILTDCIKPSLSGVNWGLINANSIVNTCGDNPSNFCLPPDILRYCSTSVNINKMFYMCGMYSHVGGYPDRNDVFNKDAGNSNSKQAYGLTGRLCPYMLKPVPNITALANTFSCCSWLGGYHKKSTGYTYIIPESFFKYVKTNSLNLLRAFMGLALPAKTSLDVFHFEHDITLNVEEAFAQVYYLDTDFGGEDVRSGKTLSDQALFATTVTNVFTDPHVYVRGMQKCFYVSTQTVGSIPERFRMNQYVFFKRVFDSTKYDRTVANGDYYVFSGYTFLYDADNPREEEVDGVTVIINERFGDKQNRTVRDDVERRNYDARNNPNKTAS